MFFVSVFEYFSRMSSGYGKRWNITHNNASGLYYCSFAYGYPGKNNHIVAQPHKIANRNVFYNPRMVIGNQIAFVVVMIVGKNLAVSTGVNVVSNGAFSFSYNVNAANCNLVANYGTFVYRRIAANKHLPMFFTFTANYIVKQPCRIHNV